MTILLASILASVVASSQVNRTGPTTILTCAWRFNGPSTAITASNDVTNRVRSQIRNNRIDMEVNNNTMGGDPNHGNKKNLKVVYTYGNGKAQTRFVNEHDWLRIT